MKKGIKYFLGLFLTACAITVIFYASVGLSNAEADSQEVRTAVYNGKQLNEDSMYADFDSHEATATEDGFVIRAGKAFDSQEFETVNLVGLDTSQDIEVEYEITYIESEGKIVLNFFVKAEEDFPILDSVEGLITANAAGEADILVADSDELIWLSDLTDDEIINNTGLWSAFKKWISNAFQEVKNAIVKGLRLAVYVAVKRIGLENGAKVLCMYKDSYGDYHADFDCWQSYAGYMDLYDFVFSLGSSMQADKNVFYDENGDGIEDYILWGWKDDYWELGAGGELGIYRRLGDSEIWYVDKKLAIYMSMTVEYRKYSYQNWTTIIDWNPQDYYAGDSAKQKQWWITGFDPDYANKDIDKTQLRVSFTVKFITKGYSSSFDRKLRDEFKLKWVDKTQKWNYNSSSQTFTYSF